MAIAKRSEALSAGEIAIPGGVYVLRVKSAEASPSKSSGNNQIALKCEIVSPATVRVGNVDVNIQGKEHTYYLGLGMVPNEKTGKRSVDYTLDVYTKLGLGDELDTEAPDLAVFDNLHFAAVLESKERILMTKDPVSGKQSPIMENGKPVTQGWQIEGFASNILRRVDPSSL